MMVEACTVSHLQIAESVPAFNTNMLHSDGTTNVGNKYGGLQVSTPDSCHTLCLTFMKAGGASDFKDLLFNVLFDARNKINVKLLVKMVLTHFYLCKKIQCIVKSRNTARHC